MLKLYVRIPEKISVSHLAKLSLLYAGNKNTENKIIKKGKLMLNEELGEYVEINYAVPGKE